MTKAGQERVQKGSKQKTAQFAAFKYYIHDTAAGYVLEVFGPFTTSAVPELNCCWQTAKTTLKNRTLTLDLRGVVLLDDEAKRWVASMVQEGAKCVPSSFLLDAEAGMPGRLTAESPSSLWSRLSNAVRSVCKPLTQAP